MGCYQSKVHEPPPPPAEFAATGGGSIIMAAPARGRGPQASETPDNSLDGSDFERSKGGSYIIGRKEAGAWEPGNPINRPENTQSTQFCDVPLSGGRILRVTWAAISKQGRSPRPPYKPNQDSFHAMSGLGNDPSVCLFSVFDGHGPKGEDASNFCRVNLSDIVVRQKSFAASPFDALAGSFEALHRRFVAPTAQRATSADTQVSGSTACSLMLQAKGDAVEWLCANVGDSRAMLVSRVAAGKGKGGAPALAPRALSSDHKPARPDERARIGRTDARILSERQLGIEGGDADKLYVCRVHNGAIRYGVLFTRSIGDADAHAHLGLIATPEVRRGRLDPVSDRYAVLATDGVWDFLTEDAVHKIVSRAVGPAAADALAAEGPLPPSVHVNAQAACEALVEASTQRWQQESDRRRDDITAVVLFFSVMSDAEAAAAPAGAGDAGQRAGPGHVHAASASQPDGIPEGDADAEADEGADGDADEDEEEDEEGDGDGAADEAGAEGADHEGGDAAPGARAAAVPAAADDSPERGRVARGTAREAQVNVVVAAAVDAGTDVDADAGAGEADADAGAVKPVPAAAPESGSGAAGAGDSSSDPSRSTGSSTAAALQRL